MKHWSVDLELITIGSNCFAVCRYILLRCADAPNCLGPTLGRWCNTGVHLRFSCQVESFGSIIYHLHNYFKIHVFPFLRWRRPSSDGPSRCPIAHFRVSSCSEFQKPSQTTTEQGKVDLCILDSRTTWRGNRMLLEAAVCLSFWNSDHVVLKYSIRSSALPRLAAVWLGFWNSDHVVLKSSICTSASPRQ